MANASTLRQHLLTAVEQMIPCVRENDFRRVILAQPPMALPPDIQVRSHRGKPLKETGQGRNHLYVDRWPAQQLHAVRFPYLGYVLEGEMDWRIGITQSMAQKLPEPLSHCDYQILTLPKQSFFLMPPGVPYSMGGVHWERPQPEQAQSRVFWLQLLPSGVFCHICHTCGGAHDSNPMLFVRDAYLAPLSELLIQELQIRAPHFEDVVRTQLLALLLRVGRALGEHKAFGSDAEFADLAPQQGAQELIAPLNEQAVKRACSFIEAHLHEPLAPSGVASHAYMSSSHLNRLFRAELGVTIMKYVTGRRLKTAESLLLNSDLPIQEVGRIVGYSNPSRFTQVFSQESKISPLAYRKRGRERSTVVVPPKKKRSP